LVLVQQLLAQVWLAAIQLCQAQAFLLLPQAEVPHKAEQADLAEVDRPLEVLAEQALQDKVIMAVMAEVAQAQVVVEQAQEAYQAREDQVLSL
jgi:hypothetical protein